MKAICFDQAGGPEVLYVGEVQEPELKEGELLIEVKAAALNRADLAQRRGLYPPVPGESEILGLEIAGKVTRTGTGVKGWSPGDRVCALLPGGGYAERVAIPAGMAMRLPEKMTFQEAAALPEAFLTAYLNLVWLGGMKAGHNVFVPAGASGVGTAAIQIIRASGANAYVSAGSAEKLALCSELGALAGWNYREGGSFADWLRRETGGRGVDLVLDLVGAPNMAGYVEALAEDGAILLVGLVGGSKVKELDLNPLLMKRLKIMGSTLRKRTKDEKIALTKQFWTWAYPLFTENRMKPVIDSTFPWKKAAEAHAYMESNQNKGKIVLDFSR